MTTLAGVDGFGVSFLDGARVQEPPTLVQAVESCYSLGVVTGRAFVDIEVDKYKRKAAVVTSVT